MARRPSPGSRRAPWNLAPRSTTASSATAGPGASVSEGMALFATHCESCHQARLRADLELGDELRSACLRRLGVRLEYLGYIDFDDTVWACVRNRTLLLAESPGAKSAKAIEKRAINGSCRTGNLGNGRTGTRPSS